MVMGTFSSHYSLHKVIKSTLVRTSQLKQIILILVCIVYANSLSGQKLTTSEIKQDFEIFRTALTKAHPGIYRYESKNTVDSIFQETEKGLEGPITQQQFYQILSPLIAFLHCGHTKLYPDNFDDENHPYYFETEYLFPLRLHFSDQRAFYVESYDQDVDIQEGTEIIEINGKSVTDLITILLKNIAADGRVLSSKYMDLNDEFPAFYANLIGSPKSFNLVLKDKRETFKRTISATSLIKIHNYENRHVEESEPTFSLTYPEKQLALMRIKKFYPQHKGDNFKKFLKKSFKEINKKKVKKLIIDLRDNGGGKDRWGSLLFSYLTDQPYQYYESLRIPTKTYSFKQYAELPKLYGLIKLLVQKDPSGGYRWTRHKNLRIQKPQKQPFMGEVIVVVNGFSFSAASEFASVAKASGRVKIAGEETGGAYGGNNSGLAFILSLPNSELLLEIPMVGVYMAVPPVQPYDRGVLPNLELDSSIQGIINAKN